MDSYKKYANFVPQLKDKVSMGTGELRLYVKYDLYQNTKRILNAVQKGNEMRMNHELKQKDSLFLLFLYMKVLELEAYGPAFNRACQKCIYFFSSNYLKNTLATSKNLNNY